MDRRTWVSSAAVAAITTLAVLLGGSGRAGALAETLQPFKEAKSFSCEMAPLQDGKPAPGADRVTVRMTWAAPGSLRVDVLSGGKAEQTTIAPHGKTGVVLNHRDKTYRPTGGQPGHQEATLLKLIDGLAAYSGGDQKSVGTDMIGLVRAPRFDLKIPAPEAKDVFWRAHIWAHPETKRPLRVEFATQAGKAPSEKGVSGVRLEKFDWDVKADGLFDTTPPAGYKSAVAEK